MKITNPVLTGFHPDASVVKVGQDYYLATSTFEWMPGVEIYHTKNLVDWQLVSNPLQQKDQANLIGNYNSGSIWAPHLSYSEGKFWLLITDVKTGNAFKDTLNYVLSCETIDGDWGEPVFITASGFDPAFFHDDDGRHYILSMLFDHRLEKPNFSGLVMQEYDLKEMKLVGKRKHFFTGTDLGVCEGPQIIKKDGYYYLLAAAGGTGYSHAATVCRSKDVFGPYEVSPYHPLLTSKPDPTLPLQKSGHASFIEVTKDEWYISHICARPLTQRGACVLGRETALQPIEWIDGWPRLTNGTIYPDLEIVAPSIAKNVVQTNDHSTSCDFSEKTIPTYFKSLRRPMEEKTSLTDCPGYLRLYGEQSLTSVHNQTIVVRRFQDFSFKVETEMTFDPDNFQQMAGLTLFYDTDNWHYLHVSYDEDLESRYIQLETDELNQFSYASERIPIKGNAPIQLVVEVDHDKAQFYFGTSEKLKKIGDTVAVDTLSDDFIKANGKLAFTGAMVGICAQDMDDHSSYADFSYFNYTSKN